MNPPLLLLVCLLQHVQGFFLLQHVTTLPPLCVAIPEGTQEDRHPDKFQGYVGWEMSADATFFSGRQARVRPSHCEHSSISSILEIVMGRNVC